MRRENDIQTAQTGTEIADFAHLNNDLAWVQKVLGHAGKAEKLARRVLGISERLYGTTHHRVVSCLSNMAPVLLALKEMDAVNQDYQIALKIRKAALGSWHSDAATSLNNLALVEAALGDPEKCRSVSYP